jgi:hypothetical protein
MSLSLSIPCYLLDTGRLAAGVGRFSQLQRCMLANSFAVVSRNLCTDYILSLWCGIASTLAKVPMLRSGHELCKVIVARKPS